MGRRTTPGRRGRALGLRAVARGFTLVEILVVVVIVGILVSLAQPRLLSAVVAAREAALEQDLAVMRDALDQHYADTGRYPPTLDALVERRYLRRVPKDPMTRRADTWRLVYDLDAEGRVLGIYDVKSGSDARAQDGTPYAEW